jgi:hypothetical protein
MNSLHLVAGIPSHRTPYAAKPITFHVPRFRPENFAALLPCLAAARVLRVTFAAQKEMGKLLPFGLKHDALS